MEVEDSLFNIYDESQSLDTLPPTYEDAIRASEDARNDMDVTLHPSVNNCTSDSYDRNHSSGNLCTSRGMMISINPLMSQNTSCIRSGADTYQFSMDGMPLKPWSVENSLISEPSGMVTSTDPLGFKSGGSASPIVYRWYST
jgi:hypothetical protein